MVADKEAETDWVSGYMRGYWTGRDHCFTDVTRLERENQELVVRLVIVDRPGWPTFFIAK